MELNPNVSLLAPSKRISLNENVSVIHALRHIREIEVTVSFRIISCNLITYSARAVLELDVSFFKAQTFGAYGIAFIARVVLYKLVIANLWSQCF